MRLKLTRELRAMSIKGMPCDDQIREATNQIIARMRIEQALFVSAIECWRVKINSFGSPKGIYDGNQQNRQTN